MSRTVPAEKENKKVSKRKRSGESVQMLGKYYYKGRGIIEPEINLEDLLIHVLSEHGPLTRGKLAEITGIPRTTLYDNLTKLILSGKVKKSSVRRKKRGRPKVLFEVI